MSIASPSTFTMTQFVRLPMRAESARDLQYLRHIKYVGGEWRLVSKPPMVRTEARTQLLQQDRFEIPSDLHPAPTDLYAIPSAVATCDSLSPRQSIQPICIPAPTPRLNLDLYDSLPLNLTSKPDVLDEEDGMIFMTRGSTPRTCKHRLQADHRFPPHPWQIVSRLRMRIRRSIRERCRFGGHARRPFPKLRAAARQRRPPSSAGLPMRHTTHSAWMSPSASTFPTQTLDKG